MNLFFVYFQVLLKRMAEPKGCYNGKLLTLNANSSDEYVKSIYDEWAENYDKVRI